MLARDGELELTAAWPPEDTLDAAAMTAARWAFSHVEPAGTGTNTLPIIPWFFVPLRIGERTLGVVGVARTRTRRRSIRRRGRCSMPMSEQAASAVDRASLTREMVSARSAAEAERVRKHVARIDLA